MPNCNYTSNKKLLELSIIIVNYKAHDLLLQCLSSVYKMLTDIDFEIIVVDNASGDNTADSIKKNFPLVELLVNSKNFGFSKACNQALRVMKGEYALLLNPDTIILDPNFKEMIGFLEENQQVGILGCRILDEQNKIQRSAFPKPTVLKELLDIVSYLKLEKILPAIWTNRFYDKLTRESISPFEVFWVSGACLLIRKKVLKEIGFLDENLFLFSEDVDLAWRSQKNGWKAMFYPQVSISHVLGGSSLKDAESLYLRLFHSYTRRLYFGRKYYSKFANFLIRTTMVINLLIRLVYIKSKFDKDSSLERKKAKVKAYREALRAVFF